MCYYFKGLEEALQNWIHNAQKSKYVCNYWLCMCLVFCFFLAYLKFRACALFCELIFRLYMIMDSQRINCKIALLVRCLRCQSTISSQRSTYTGVQGWNGSQWPYFKLVWAIKQSLTNHILHTVDLWSHHL